ncbi:MAG TPA: SDR family NAD(P)-dependent oxidoreductase [Nitrospirae bacterium]|nr:SDR family NAD(P)-dependent oxidoreductase [Nitrospirota bacterium]
MVCLITGSSRGLGKVVALAFSKRGHQVVIHYKDRKNEAEEVASQIKDSFVLKADVGDFNEVKTLVNDVINKWGRIDVLINNAGITKEALLIKTSEKDFDDVINTNLKGPFNFIRTVGRHMMKQKSGHIINVSSFAGVKGKEGLSAYSASKAGLTGLMKTAAKELNRYNIMVNAVLPGYMLTDMGTEANDRAKETALKESLVENFSEPDNVAEFICYLSETTGITGQVFNLDSRIL